MTSETSIFLSSTWKDLEEHRKAVLFILARLKKQVESMEYFGSMPGEPIDECLEKVRNSAFFIGILGTTYGSIALEGKSFTELEYDEAFRQKKKILIYCIDEDNHPVLPKYVDIGENAIKLADFKKKVLKTHITKKFSSPDHLSSIIGIDLIKLYEDMGKNIRAALEKNNIKELLVDAGFSISDADVSLNIAPNLDPFGSGSFRFSNKSTEAFMAAGFIAQNLQNNNFDILKHIVSLRSEVANLLSHLLSYCKIEEYELANAILKCQDSFQLRLLINIAGAIKSDICAESICKRLFDLKNHHNIIKDYDLMLTPFNDVVKNALGSLSACSEATISKYIELAKKQKKWRQKELLERSLKLLHRENC